MSTTPSEIEFGRLYSFAEACKLLPSCHAGKHVHIATLHRWREQKRFTAECRTSKGRRYWFVFGSELLKLVAQPTVMSSPAKENRRHQKALEECRRLGVKV